MEPQYAFESAPQNSQPLGLSAATQQIQEKGRGNDTMLVHMTPNEVRGLDGLARAYGGQLTTNPETGLPEAGFLDSILPVVAGAALNVAFPGLGTALGGFAIPGLVGGATALASGDLGKGLMAGLGAWGGAGLAGGFMGAGQAASSAAATAGAPQTLVDAAGRTVANFAGPMAPTVSGLDAVKLGAQNLLSSGTAGEAARASVMANLGGMSGAAKTAGAIAAPMLLGGGPQAMPPPGTGTYIRPYTFTRTQRPDAFSTRPTTGAGSFERRFFDDVFTPGTPYKVANYAQGGLTALAEGGLQDGGFVIPADVVSHFGNGSNEAGQELLAEQLSAIPIKGDGDGMSDSIQTTIEGTQAARVADGEAYIPPEVVEKVGAKRLYAMMNKIRMARTGTEKQAPEVEAENFLPT